MEARPQEVRLKRPPESGSALRATIGLSYYCPIAGQ